MKYLLLLLLALSGCTKPYAVGECFQYGAYRFKVLETGQYSAKVVCVSTGTNMIFSYNELHWSNPIDCWDAK